MSNLQQVIGAVRREAGLESQSPTPLYRRLQQGIRKALEQGVFRNPTIAALLAREEIVPMKVDITGNNPAGKAKLKEAGTLTIPLLVVFSPNGQQVFKSDFYTVDQILNAVEKALVSREAPEAN